MRVLIVDDEGGIREALHTMLNKYFPGQLEIEEADSVHQALNVLAIFRPAIVLLDVELTDGTGFDLLSQLKTRDFAVIFVTAYSEYAIQALKLNAVDYLLKPVDSSELRNAVAAAQRYKLEQYTVQFDALLSYLKDPFKAGKRIVLKTTDTIYLHDVSEIIRCESDDNYTSFYLASGTRILVSRTLKDYEELLEPFGFFRVHQSHLINLNSMQRFDKRDGGYVIMHNGDKIPVSSRKRDALIRILESL